MRIVVRAPGVSSSSPADVGEHRRGQPGQRRHAGAQRSANSSSPRMAASVIARTWSPAPARAASISITSPCDERRVHVEDDQPLAAPGQPGPLHGDVHARRARDVHQLLAQRAGRVFLRALARHRRDQQLQPGDRVVGDAADRVDVRADVGEGPRDRPERARGDRPPEHHDDVRGVPARGRVVGHPQRGLHLHGDARHRLLDGLLQALRVVVRGDERAQREPPPDDDLLDVEQVDAVPGERGEEDGADAGAVRTGDRDEDGGGTGTR